jgi:hypothetical protein
MASLTRRRAGRKPLSASGITPQIHVSFGDDMYDKLKNYCEAYGFPISAFVRMAVEKELTSRINNISTVKNS